MAHSIEELELYALCPRRYKFKYIEKATHSTTAGELFQIAHRRAFNFFMEGVKAGKQPTGKEYYKVWLEEWESKKMGVAIWTRKEDKNYPERAKIQSTELADDLEWPAFIETNVTKKCAFGNPWPPEIYVNIDFVTDSAFGFLHFSAMKMTANSVDASYKANVIQLLKIHQDIIIAGLAHRGRNTNTTVVRERLWRRPALRVVASIFDQVEGIKNESFPRCHPKWEHCSPFRCGYWRVCTNSTPRKKPKIIGVLQ